MKHTNILVPNVKPNFYFSKQLFSTSNLWISWWYEAYFFSIIIRQLVSFVLASFRWLSIELNAPVGHLKFDIFWFCPVSLLWKLFLTLTEPKFWSKLTEGNLGLRWVITRARGLTQRQRAPIILEGCLHIARTNFWCGQSCTDCPSY